MFNNDYTAEEIRFRALEKLFRDLAALVTKLARQVAKLLDDNGEQRPQQGGGGGGGWIGQTTTTIPTYYAGGGMVRPTTLQKASTTDADPKQTDTGADPVPAYNLTGGQIPAGKNVAGIFIGPYRVITTANCANTNPLVADPAPVAAPGPPVAVTTNNNTFVTDGTDQPMMTA
jgi:hypothetical protein